MATWIKGVFVCCVWTKPPTHVGYQFLGRNGEEQFNNLHAVLMWLFPKSHSIVHNRKQELDKPLA